MSAMAWAFSSSVRSEPLTSKSIRRCSEVVDAESADSSPLARLSETLKSKGVFFKLSSGLTLWTLIPPLMMREVRGVAGACLASVRREGILSRMGLQHLQGHLEVSAARPWRYSVLIGAPEGGCLDQGIVFKKFISWFPRGSRGFMCEKRTTPFL